VVDEDLSYLDGDEDVEGALIPQSYRDAICRTLTPWDVSAPAAQFEGSVCASSPSPPSKKPKSPVGGRGHPPKSGEEERKRMKLAKTTIKNRFKRIKEQGGNVHSMGLHIQFYKDVCADNKALDQCFRANLFEILTEDDPYKSEKLMLLKNSEIVGLMQCVKHEMK
jgi:hypothetical protein